MFSIKKESLISVPKLARLNLKLSITRDENKEKALLGLLNTQEFKNMKSVLVYCTKKKTCNQVANYLTQNGMPSKPYHAGMEDSQRNFV